VKYADISGLSETELNKKTTELRLQMFEARMKNSLGQLANPMSIREARRDIARMKTAAAAKTVQPERNLSREARALSKAKSVKG